MKKIRKLLLIFLLILLLPVGSLAEDSKLGIEDRAVSYLIGDFESGRVLEEYNIDQPLNIASISKLMTYLVVKDQVDQGQISLEDRVTVTAEMEAVGGSNFRLLEGEVLTVDQLLTGLMVVSGNDAAYALAVHTAGDEASFVDMMNKTAQELGLENAKFVNSHGLESPDGQNTLTTHEIFNLSKHIIGKYPEILDYGSISILSMPERNYVGYTTLPLTGIMPGVDGLKTGFTEEAGYCLVATMDAGKTAINEDYRLITVVMGTANLDERRDLSQYLLEYGMNNYHINEVLNSEMPYSQIQLNSAKTQTVPVYAKESFQVLAKRDQNFTYEETKTEGLKAPLKAGDKVGEVRVYDQGEEIVSQDLIVKHDIEQAGIFTRIIRSIESTVARLASFLRR